MRKLDTRFVISAPEAAALPENPSHFCGRGQVLPTIAIGKVQGRVCLSLPFVFGVIYLVPGLYPSPAPSPHPHN